MSVQKIFELKAQNGLNTEERVRLKENGRPQPNLNITYVRMDNDKKVNRYFHQSMYDWSEWICGCDVKNAFFCFPCLLFCEDALWCRNGVIDLKHLKTRIQSHTVSASHMKNSMNFAALGNVDMKLQLDSDYRKSIEEFNERVRKNRYILNKIIDCIKFCGAFELALHGDDESDTFENPGVFRGLIDFVSELDSIFKDHIQGMPKEIQYDLLDSMLAVIHDKIKSEIEQTDFIAIQVDEMTDSSSKTQLVFIIRYVLNGVVHERFWKFINPIGTGTPQELTNAILKELEILKVNEKPTKLIGQSYYSASARSGKFGVVQAEVRQTYPSANFIHCYAHHLNLILEKTVIQFKPIRIFFANLNSFSTFFEKSPKRTAVLDELVKDVVKVRLPTAGPTKWYFNTKCIETVSAYQNHILICIEKIINTEEDFASLNQAIGLKNYLKNKDFLYWLDYFYQIISHRDILFDQLQKHDIDVKSVKKYVSDFKSNMQIVRSKVLNNIVTAAPSPSRKRSKNEDSKDRIALEVCDIFVLEMERRFSFVNHLIVSQLFYADKFEEHKNCFPQHILKLVKTSYPVVNELKLKTELEVLYHREDFYGSAGAIPILKFFINNNLCQTFSESVKLLNILCTLPMTTKENKRCFSTVNRIQTFLHNTMGQEHLSAVTMLSMEKSLIKKIDHFNELVIDHFASTKERSIDLKYKSF